jgi:hypothetical protein
MLVHNYLLSMPTWQAFLLVVLISIVYSVAGILVVRRFVHHSVLQRHHEVAGFIFTTLGVIYAVLLAFVVLIVWEHFSKAEENMALEEAVALSVHETIENYPSPEIATMLRTLFVAYVQSVFKEEFPQLRAGKTDPHANEMFTALIRAVWQINPATQGEQRAWSQLQGDLRELAKYRAERFLANMQSTPRVVWRMLILGALVTVGFTFLFGTEKLIPQLIMNACCGAVIAMVLVTIIELDNPFLGEVSIQPMGYQTILNRAAGPNRATTSFPSVDTFAD